MILLTIRAGWQKTQTRPKDEPSHRPSASEGQRNQEANLESYEEIPLPGVVPVGRITLDVLLDPDEHVVVIELKTLGADGTLIGLVSIPGGHRTTVESLMRRARQELTDAVMRHTTPF